MRVGDDLLEIAVKVLEAAAGYIEGEAHDLVQNWEGGDSGPQGERPSDDLFDRAERVLEVASALRALLDSQGGNTTAPLEPGTGDTDFGAS